MKNMKKIVALLVAVLMLVASVSAFAAPAWVDETHYDTTFNDSTLDGSLQITGLEKQDEVKFYKVLEFDPDATDKVADATTLSAGGWTVVAPFNAAQGGLTVEEFKAMLTTGITEALAAKLATLATTAQVAYDETADDNGSVTVTDDVNTANVTEPEAGLYVALVTPAAAGYVYNPIIVSADYYTTTSGDKSSAWEVVNLADSYAGKSTAKKTKIPLTKEAAEDNEDTNETGEAKTVGVGDKINFTVKTIIPEFADNYTAPLFVLTDSLSDGLTLDQSSIKVYKATVSGDNFTKGDQIEEVAANFTIDPKSATGYKVKFNPTYLLGLSTYQPIIVEYSATVTEAAITNVNEEDNTVTLEYSHKPDVDDEGEGQKLRDKTHHYTFTIDGVIWGDSSYKTTEVVKVGLDKDGNEITQTVEMHSGKKIGALAGAKFKLYTDAELKKEYKKGDFAPDGKTIVSDSEGRLTVEGTTNGIRGLDAGTYYLVETEAPAGYIKQQAATKIEIIPEFYPEIEWTDADHLKVKCNDLMKQYTVKIDNATTATYVIQYKDAFVNDQPVNDLFKGDITNMKGTSEGDIVIGNSGPITTITADKDEEDDDGKIINTQGVELPSTGGMGTTILYIGGSILVILAAVLLITKRRMNAED